MHAWQVAKRALVVLQQTMLKNIDELCTFVGPWRRAANVLRDKWPAMLLHGIEVINLKQVVWLRGVYRGVM